MTISSSQNLSLFYWLKFVLQTLIPLYRKNLHVAHRISEEATQGDSGLSSQD